MILDANLQFSDSQAVTAAAASTNIIDMGKAGQDIGTGEDLYLVVQCEVAMTDAGSDSALDVAIEGDSTSTITPDATQSVITFPALSPAGTVKIAKLDPGSLPLQLQYIQLKYTPSNGNLTTGTFSAFLTNNIDKFKSFANNSTIS